MAALTRRGLFAVTAAAVSARKLPKLVAAAPAGLAELIAVCRQIDLEAQAFWAGSYWEHYRPVDLTEHIVPDEAV